MGSPREGLLFVSLGLQEKKGEPSDLLPAPQPIGSVPPETGGVMMWADLLGLLSARHRVLAQLVLTATLRGG